MLVAVDDDALRSTLVRAFDSDGYRVTETSDGDETLQRLGELLFQHEAFPDLVLCTLHLTHRSGLDVLTWVEHLGRGTPVVLLGDGDVEGQMLARRLGAAAVLSDPLDVDDLRERVLELLVFALGSSTLVAHEVL